MKYTISQNVTECIFFYFLFTIFFFKRKAFFFAISFLSFNNNPTSKTKFKQTHGFTDKTFAHFALKGHLWDKEKVVF